MFDRLTKNKLTTSAGGLTLVYAVWEMLGQPAPAAMLQYVHEMDNVKFIGLVALGVALLLARD